MKESFKSQMEKDVTGDSEKQDYKRGKFLTFRVKLARWIPWVKIPRDVLDFVAEQARDKAIKAMQFMQTERQLGKFNFRRQIDMNDIDLDKMVVDNQIALMGASREYSIVYDYLIFSGRMLEYVQFRAQVEDAIQRNIAEERATMERMKKMELVKK